MSENESGRSADIPIIFSGPMVRALIDGRKTMTRRLAWRDAKFGLQDLSSEQLEDMDAKGWNVVGEGNDGLWRVYKPTRWQRVKPGGRLWVKEAIGFTSDHMSFFYEADKSCLPDSKIALLRKREAERGKPYVNLSARYVPRFTSRLTLIVTATKIERLQDISEDDAEAEGLWYCDSGDAAGWWFSDKDMHGMPGGGTIECFQFLWESLHGESSWRSNPEVVALTFEVHKQNIDAMTKERAA